MATLLLDWTPTSDWYMARFCRLLIDSRNTRIMMRLDCVQHTDIILGLVFNTNGRAYSLLENENFHFDLL